MRLGCVGGMDHRIGPLSGLPETFVGVAVTCDCGPGDNLAAAAASKDQHANGELPSSTIIIEFYVFQTACSFELWE